MAHCLSARWRACLLITVIACLCSGCPTDHPSDQQPGGALNDELKIKVVILQALFDEQLGKNNVEANAFSSYVLKDRYGSSLVYLFRDHRPPISTTIQVGHDSMGRAIDAATGQPVKIFSVRIRQLGADHATAGAGWEVSTLEGEWFSYELEQVNGKWVIKRRAVAGVT